MLDRAKFSFLVLLRPPILIVAGPTRCVGGAGGCFLVLDWDSLLLGFKGSAAAPVKVRYGNTAEGDMRFFYDSIFIHKGMGFSLGLTPSL